MLAFSLSEVEGLAMTNGLLSLKLNDRACLSKLGDAGLNCGNVLKRGPSAFIGEWITLFDSLRGEDITDRLKLPPLSPEKDGLDIVIVPPPRAGPRSALIKIYNCYIVQLLHY